MSEPESRPSGSVIWAVLLTALVGGVAVGVRRPFEDSSPPPSKKEAAAMSTSSSPVDSLAPLRDFLSTGIKQAIPSMAEKEMSALRKRYDIEYLVVTVPDPIDSRFGYAFDQLMNVIQRALEENGYVFDRQWSPWELDKKKLKDKEQTAPSLRLELFGINLFPAASKPTEESAYRELFPGMILFRAKGLCRDKLCIVYLIGENPTSGLDKPAFTASLELIDRYPPHGTGFFGPYPAGSKSAVSSARTNTQPDSSLRLIRCAYGIIMELIQGYWPMDHGPIRIVGPCFSGSQTSMNQVLDDWKKEHPNSCFRVISGSATAVDRNKFLPSEGRTTFQATVIPTDQILRATLHYLKRRNESQPYDRLSDLPDEMPGNVAFLVEANTGFGQFVQAGIKKLQNGSQPKGKYPRPAANRLLVVPFPLHISGVEESYDKLRRLRDQQLGIPRPEALIPDLGKPPDGDSDLIPAQDSATTASVNGAILTKILWLIAHKQMEYVGIVASDPRDTIFLATALREHCPASQIFILGSDLLYSLPQFSYQLKGTIIGSTYPLVPINQRWTNPEATINQSPSRLVFASDAAQGYYNAIMAQLDNPEKMLEYRPPLGAESNRPPIWINMIGQNGDLVPLQFFTNYENTDYLWPPSGTAPPPCKVRIKVPFPGTAWLALAAACLAAALLLCYAFRHYSPEPFWRAPRRQTRASFWRGMVLRSVAFLSFGVLMFPIAHLSAIYLKNEGSRELAWWKPFLLILPLVVLGLLGPALLYPLFPAARRSLSSTGIRTGSAWVALAATVLLASTWTFLAGREDLLILLWSVLPAYAVILALLYLFMRAAASRLLRSRPGPWIEAGVACTAVAVLAPPIHGAWRHLVDTAYTYVPYLRGFPDSWEALFFYRTLNFASGVSLLLPLFFLCAAFFCWAFFQMKARWDFRRYFVRIPYPSQRGQGMTAIFGDVRTGGQVIANELQTVFVFVRNHPIEVLVLAFVIFIGSWRLCILFLPIAEGPFWTWLFAGGFTLGSLLVVVDLLRFLAIWSRLKNLFHEVTLIPMMAAFDRLPAKLVSVFGGYLHLPRARLSLLRLPLHQLRLLQQETERLSGYRTAEETGLVRGNGAADTQLDSDTLRRLYRDLLAFEQYVAGQYPGLAIESGDGEQSDSPRTGGPLTEEHWLIRRARKLLKFFSNGRQTAKGQNDRERVEPPVDLTEEDRPRILRNHLIYWSRRLLKLLPRFWPRRSIEEAFGPNALTTSQQDSSASARCTEASPPELARWSGLAEGFVAMAVVLYISQFIVQLRTLAWSMIVCSVLLLLAATSYPFQPERVILYTMLGLIGAVVVTLVYVLVQINRNELISRISGTTANRFVLDRGFISHVFTYIVPALGVVALQLFGAFRFLLEPILRVLQ